MTLARDESSFLLSLGGQGNAVGWSVQGRGRLALPDATYGRSARTVMLVTWGTQPESCIASSDSESVRSRWESSR